MLMEVKEVEGGAGCCLEREREQRRGGRITEQTHQREVDRV